MSARPKRPSKPDVVLLSDDDDDEPAAKRTAEPDDVLLIDDEGGLAAKINAEPELVHISDEEIEPEPSPSQEVLELRQKVAKLEKDCKGAIRIAGEHQARVEMLERIIDQKPTMGDDGEKNLVIELQKMLVENSKQLSNVRREAATREEDLESKVLALTIESEAEKQRARDEQTRYRTRIDKMARKLAKFENGQQQNRSPSGSDTMASNTPRPPQLDEITQPVKRGHPTNLFLLYSEDTSASISFDGAVGQLYKLYCEDGKEKFKKHYQRTGERLECGACAKTVDDADVIGHFLSPPHCRKVRLSAHSLSVSFDALEHWLKQLRLTAATAAKTEEEEELGGFRPRSYEDRQQALYEGLGDHR